MNSKYWAYFFVLVQFSSLFFILTTAPVFASSDWGILVEMAGVFVGLLAIYQMQVGNFNIAPLPKAGGKLVTSGLYTYVRHPMYMAQLLAALPLIIDYFSTIRLAVWLALFINLIFKLYYEERKLINQFSAYKAYMETTWRLIPFVY